MLSQVLDSRLVSVAADKVWVGSGVGAPVLDMAETVPPGTRIARVLAGNCTSTPEFLFTASCILTPPSFRGPGQQQDGPASLLLAFRRSQSTDAANCTPSKANYKHFLGVAGRRTSSQEVCSGCILRRHHCVPSGEAKLLGKQNFPEES